MNKLNNKNDKVYPESDFQQLSGLQHLAFCPRQWALIHLEGLWQENVLTAEGRQMHDRAHEGDDESRGDKKIVRGLRIHSFRLGLSGMTDVVEFYRDQERPWQPFPVEYKHGKPKPDSCDEVQLCAQALCLEEMLDVPIEKGTIYYGKPRRRQEIEFNGQLRAETETLAFKLHAMANAGVTPAAVYTKACESCSLINQCLPKITEKKKQTVAEYIYHMTKE